MEDINLKVLSREEKERIKKAIKKKRHRYAKKTGDEHEKLRAKMLEMLSAAEKKEEDKPSEEVSIVNNELFQQYEGVFERFNNKAEAALESNINEDAKNKEQEKPEEPVDDETSDVEKHKPKNKKQLKKSNRMSVAQLKVLVDRPDLVESWDVTAPDPLLLMHLKAYKNTVEVPKNWVVKKKGLDQKRGFFKKTFKLPDYIENTGIAKLRDPLVEKSSLKMVRQKLKERMNPRLGKIDIDYEVLHDAFFKYQTKPQMTDFGDIYYEGKEEDQKVKTYRPGHLSAELRIALGISANALPPWIMNMQKFGPPPSYPNFKLPGLSASLGGFGYGKQLMEYGGHEEFEMDTNYFWGEMRDDTNDVEDYNDEMYENQGVEYRNEYLQLEEIGAYEEEPLFEDRGTVPKEHHRSARESDGEPYKVLSGKETKSKGFLASDYVYNISK